MCTTASVPRAAVLSPPPSSCPHPEPFSSHSYFSFSGDTGVSLPTPAPFFSLLPLTSFPLPSSTDHIHGTKNKDIENAECSSFAVGKRILFILQIQGQARNGQSRLLIPEGLDCLGGKAMKLVVRVSDKTCNHMLKRFYTE